MSNAVILAMNIEISEFLPSEDIFLLVIYNINLIFLLKLSSEKICYINALYEKRLCFHCTCRDNWPVFLYHHLYNKYT